MRLSLKKYEDICIGDTISIFNTNAVRYRVIKKCVNEELYKSETGSCFKRNRKLMCLTPEIDYNKLLGSSQKNGLSGALTEQKFENIVTIAEGTITFRKEYIKWIKDDLYEQTTNIKTGDIIWDTNNGEHYYIGDYNSIQSMEYGGQTYDSSYYKIYRIDRGGSTTDKQIRKSSWGSSIDDWLKTSHKSYQLYVGDFAMNAQNYYPIVKKD